MFHNTSRRYSLSVPLSAPCAHTQDIQEAEHVYHRFHQDSATGFAQDRAELDPKRVIVQNSQS